MNEISVENLLAEYFEDELTNTTTTNIMNITEEWFINNKKHLNVLIDNISSNFKPNLTKRMKYKQQIKINLNVNDSEFEHLFRMKRSTFQDLHEELNSNSVLVIMDELLFCLWLLGNSKLISDIAVIFKVNQKYIFKLCEKYCKAIVELLSERYIIWPNLLEEMSIENGFRTDYQFPGVLGVVGCLHVNVWVPEDHPNALDYFNENIQNDTIVLQAVCDNNLLFRDIYVGYPGSNSTNVILESSPLYRKLTDKDSFLVKSNKYLLGGTEHPQMNTLLTPYSILEDDGERQLNEEELKFNELHASVMETMGTTFRMVDNRFQRLNNLDMASPKFATVVVAAICALHNFCRLRNDFTYC